MIKRIAWIILLCTAGLANAQEGEPSTSGTSASETEAPAIRPEEKRLFGLVPNYKTVPANSVVTPMGWRGKFQLAARDTFDPMAFVIVGINAGQAQLSGQYPSLGQGMAGYGRRYIRAEGDLIISNFLTEAILPSAFRYDPRYFRLGEGAAGKRSAYALSRIWRIRGDDGKTHFNLPELLGNALAVTAGILYYPPESRKFSSVGQRYVFQVGTDAAFNLLKEFWPDINDRFLRRKSRKAVP